MSQVVGRSAKRLLDVLVAAGGLLILSPLMALGAVGVMLAMGRPVLFADRRPGRHEKLFTLYKFRTMRSELGANGELLPDKERLTGFGRWLRRTSLDELPQLWNVLTGDVSLVGPRPLRVEYLPYFTSTERLRHTVRPGITGWAQVHGRNETSWDERFRHDVWYVRNWTFGLDLRILAKTCALVARRQGVLADAQAKGMLNLDKERAWMVDGRPRE
jgi:lipopolysaccharide/colanic/teichoic acid biosynthesis glycosyltransferase